MVDVDNKIKMIVEGLLLAAGKPLSLSVIAGVFSEDERPENAELRDVLTAIAEDCNDRGFELKEVASGFRFQVKQDISEWISRLWEEKPPRYSRALLETLALIAYRQPITRGDIEEIRGVGVSSNIMRTLIDREWVRVVGHKDVPGKPALYATTRQFLDYFNLKSIQELPPLSEIRELTKSSPEFDLEDDLATRNVLEVPEEEPEGPAQVIGEEGEVLVFNAEDLPDEDEAAALARKPLDEILGLSSEEDVIDDEEAMAEGDEPAFEPEADDEDDEEGKEKSGEDASEDSVSDQDASEQDAADALVREASDPTQEDSTPEHSVAERNALGTDEEFQPEDSYGREPAAKPDSDREPAAAEEEVPASGTGEEEVAADVEEPAPVTVAEEDLSEVEAPAAETGDEEDAADRDRPASESGAEQQTSGLESGDERQAESKPAAKTSAQ